MNILFITVLLNLSASGATPPIEKLKLPEGFKIQLHAQGVEGARQLALGARGTLFVGTSGDKVHAVLPDGKVLTLASGLNRPNGVAFKDGALFVGEIHRVIRFDRIEERLSAPPKPAVVYDQLPKDGHHGLRFISFGPDGKLYLGIGAPCNVCERADARYASISRMNEDGSKFETFASGVRNTVGFDWHPKTGELWFTDNGRDWLGDNSPPDELNVASRSGQHFGFPYCHGRGIKDPEFGGKRQCTGLSPAEMELGPHVAALGMTFYTGKTFPAEYKNQILIAEHGSWNRSDPIGYRISLVKTENGKPVKYSTFVEGWLQGGKPWGRPVDVLSMDDGSVLVSDDFAGVIYRITARQ